MEEKIIIENPYGFIYITTNMINGKKYIGQKMFRIQWQSYLGSGAYFLRAVKKYGKENFSREIIAIAHSKEELDKLEIEFIKNHNAVDNEDYYNLVDGGGTTAGHHHSEETKRKIGETKKGNTYNLGKHATDDHKQKISEAHKGRIWSEESKQKLSKAHKGKPKSEEAKQKMSESHIASETSKKTKFTDKQVTEIREKYATGKYKQSELAREYNCDRSVINNIVNYKHAYKKVVNT